LDRSEIDAGVVSIPIIAAQPDTARNFIAARSNEFARVSPLPRQRLLKNPRPLARDTLADRREYRRLAKFTLPLPYATRTGGKREESGSTIEMHGGSLCADYFQRQASSLVDERRVDEWGNGRKEGKWCMAGAHGVGGARGGVGRLLRRVCRVVGWSAREGEGGGRAKCTGMENVSVTGRRDALPKYPALLSFLPSRGRFFALPPFFLLLLPLLSFFCLPRVSSRLSKLRQFDDRGHPSGGRLTFAPRTRMTEDREG